MAASELYAADVDALVRVLDEAREDEPGPGMPWALLEGLQRLVPCDLEVNYQHHEPPASRTLLIHSVEPGPRRIDPSGPEPSAPEHPFWQYWWHGLCSWPQRSGDLRRVVHTGDFFATDRERLADPICEVLPELRAAMIADVPAFGLENAIVPMDWSPPSLPSDASGPVGYPISDFYMTNAVCRASPTMQRCSAEITHGQEWAEAAE